MPRGKPKDNKGPAREVIEGRLFLSDTASFHAGQLHGISVLVILGGSSELGTDAKDLVRVSWTCENEVDEKVLEGVVRMCASAMKGREQSVLLVGDDDAIDTIAACIIREYLGCGAQTAIGIVRQDDPKRLSRQGLVAAVTNFKPS